MSAVDAVVATDSDVLERYGFTSVALHTITGVEPVLDFQNQVLSAIEGDRDLRPVRRARLTQKVKDCCSKRCRSIETDLGANKPRQSVTSRFQRQSAVLAA